MWHPSIVYSKSVMRRLNTQTISTRPACPFCDKAGLTGELVRNKDHYDTMCEICGHNVMLDDHFKVFFWDIK